MDYKNSGGSNQIMTSMIQAKRIKFYYKVVTKKPFLILTHLSWLQGPVRMHHLTAAVCTVIWYYSTVTHVTAPRVFYKNASILLCLYDGITGSIKRKHVHIGNTICQINNLFRYCFLVFRIYNKHVNIVTYCFNIYAKSSLFNEQL